MTKKIYISGKISGIEAQASVLFQKAENTLLQKGYEVVNPMKLIHNHDKLWQSYMKEDIKALMDCQEIYMLDNWLLSDGARLEYQLAKELGFKIHFEANF